MKVILIEPGSPAEHVFSRFKLPRLGLASIGTIARDQGWEVKIYVEELASLNWPEIISADLVGVSSLTPTANRALEIIKKIKEKKPDLPIVVGGPHFTFLPEEALQAGADFVVRHEGEATFTELIDHLKNCAERPLSEIKGLSFKNDGQIIHNPDRPLLENLDLLPFPDFRLIVNHQKIVNNLIQISRGCPYSCTFCSVTRMFGQRIRSRENVQAIVDEIEFLNKTYQQRFLIFSKSKHFFPYDDNFYGKPRISKEILREIIRRNLKIEFGIQVRLDVAKDREFLDLARRAGVKILYIGYESTNPETLEVFDKGLSVEEMASYTKILKSYNFRLHGMFVLGADTDTEAVIKQTVRFAKANKINTVQFIILVPLPGTPPFKEMEESGRLKHKNWSEYDGHHVVFRPLNMSERTLLYGTMVKGMLSFYSRWRCFKKIFPVFLHLPFLSKTPWKEKLMDFARYLYGHRLLVNWLRQKKSQSSKNPS